jgi:predicted small secreted protein
MKRLITLFACVLAVAACNTMEGVGKDIKKGGEAIEKAAK